MKNYKTIKINIKGEEVKRCLSCNHEFNNYCSVLNRHTLKNEYKKASYCPNCGNTLYSIEIKEAVLFKNKNRFYDSKFLNEKEIQILNSLFHKDQLQMNKIDNHEYRYSLKDDKGSIYLANLQRV